MTQEQTGRECSREDHGDLGATEGARAAVRRVGRGSVRRRERTGVSNGRGTPGLEVGPWSEDAAGGNGRPRGRPWVAGGAQER